ncbi:hypothetical protein Btru_058921 [Bulinus truncatus]|nr:hypothetical protein Btru_058921 [Bulinus truncatus]
MVATALAWERETIQNQPETNFLRTFTKLSNLRELDLTVQNKNAKVLLDLLLSCGWDNAVFITDEWTDRHSDLADAVLTRLSCLYPLILQLNISSNEIHSSAWLEKHIENLYFVHRITNVVIMSEHSVHIIQSANNVFLNHQRGLGALMIHRMQFVVFAESLYVPVLREEITFTPFDNIFIVSISKAHNSVTDMHTLMWRKNNVRELETVDASRSSLKNCDVFPNINYLMNGRALSLLTKEWLSLVYKSRDSVHGQLQYVGFFVDVVNLLAYALNFTYIFHPVAGDDDKLQWVDFAELISQSQFDIGVSVFPSISMIHYNHTVTFPLICTNLTGAYMPIEQVYWSSPLQFFRNNVYICYLFSLVYTFVMFKIYSSVDLSPNLNSRLASCTEIVTDEIIDSDHISHNRKQLVHFKCQTTDSDIDREFKYSHDYQLIGTVTEQFKTLSYINVDRGITAVLDGEVDSQTTVVPYDDVEIQTTVSNDDVEIQTTVSNDDVEIKGAYQMMMLR